MKKYILTLVILILGQSFFAQNLKPRDRDAILTTLNRQQNCWNKGDLECFMKGYWESDSLKFIGKSGLTSGWQNTLNNYKKGYPDPSSMGKLTFTILYMEKTGSKSALVIGKWHLTRNAEKGDLEGHFSLWWKKMKGTWVIVADHSS